MALLRQLIITATNLTYAEECCSQRIKMLVNNNEVIASSMNRDPFDEPVKNHHVGNNAQLDGEDD